MFSWWLDTEARDIDKRDSYLGFTAGETYSGFQSFHGEDEVYEHGEQSSMLKLKQHSLSLPEILGFCPIFMFVQIKADIYELCAQHYFKEPVPGTTLKQLFDQPFEICIA